MVAMTAPVKPTIAPIVLCAPPAPITLLSDPTAKPVIAMTMPAMFQRTYDRCDILALSDGVERPPT